MANFISPATVRKVGALLSQGHSHRAVARALGIKRTTVARYAIKLQPERCICGLPARHKGWCGPRYLKSSVHKELLAKINTDYIDPPMPDKKSLKRARRFSDSTSTWSLSDSKYPYCRGRPSDPGAALVAAVNAAVSRRLPDDARADVCQDLILSILEGDLSVGDLTPAVKKQIARRQADYSRLSVLSLDAIVGKDDAGRPITYLDKLSTDHDPVPLKYMRAAPGMTGVKAK